MNAKLLSAIVLSATITASAGIAACTSASAAKPAAQVSTSSPATPPSALPSAPAPAPSTSPPADTSGPPGTAFTVSGTDDNGNDMSYDVTLVKVDQRAQLSQYETLAASGDHTVAAKFTLTGDSGTASDDANNDAVVVGSDGQVYTFSTNSVNDGTNFNNGEFTLSSGKSLTGWVAFELPAGVTAASVQWQADPFGGSSPAEWDL